MQEPTLLDQHEPEDQIFDIDRKVAIRVITRLLSESDPEVVAVAQRELRRLEAMGPEVARIGLDVNRETAAALKIHQLCEAEMTAKTKSHRRTQDWRNKEAKAQAKRLRARKAQRKARKANR